MDEIKILIDFIEKTHLEISKEWTKDNKYHPLNMKKVELIIYTTMKSCYYMFSIIELLLMSILLILQIRYRG